MADEVESYCKNVKGFDQEPLRSYRLVCSRYKDHRGWCNVAISEGCTVSWDPTYVFTPKH